MTRFSLLNSTSETEELVISTLKVTVRLRHIFISACEQGVQRMFPTKSPLGTWAAIIVNVNGDVVSKWAT